jgi:hypothetical protein
MRGEGGGGFRRLQPPYPHLTPQDMDLLLLSEHLYQAKGGEGTLYSCCKLEIIFRENTGREGIAANIHNIASIP